MESQFDGLLLKRPGKVTLRTKEGVEAVQEAIKYLKSQSSIQPLKWSDDMANAS